MQINDLQFVSYTQDQQGIFFTFKFTKLNSTSIGGYRLYKKYNINDSFVYETIVIDSSANTDDNVIRSFNEGEFTYFNYYILTEDYGKNIFLVVAPVSRTWVEFDQSNTVDIITPPRAVFNFHTYFDNKVLNISWEDSIVNNESVTHYEVRKSKGILIQNISLSDEGILKSPTFIYNNRYLIIDKVKKVYWYGLCNSSGELSIIDENKFPFIQDTADEYEMSINNINVYAEDEWETISYVNKILSVSTYSYIETDFSNNSVYFYSIVPYATLAVSGPAVFCPIYIKNLQEVTPYLRSIGNSDNEYLASVFWRNMRDVLTDHNYYLKQQFDIPQIKGNYGFKGFLGVANCYVDVFINKNYALTVETDIFGNFQFDISLPGKENILALQARDKDNIVFSGTSTPQTIRVVTIYSFFSALSQEYKTIWGEILQQFSDFSFNESRISLLEDKLNPFVDFIKNIDEEDADYKNILITSYLSYEYAGYQKAIYMILDAFRESVGEFDYYKVFFRDTLMDTMSSGYSFVVNNRDLLDDPNSRLERGNYIYGISSCMDNGEESSISVIRVDSRWWPNKELLEQDDSYYGFNVLFWEGNADYYKIYRLDNPTSDNYDVLDFKFLQTATIPILVDFGLSIPQEGVKPPEYTITEFPKPTNLKIYYNNHIADFNINSKNKNWIRILIFERENEEIKEYQLTRMLSIFRDLIPPEIGYSVLLCNNERVKDITNLNRPDKELKPLPAIHFWMRGNLNNGVYYDPLFSGDFELVKNQIGFNAYGSLNYNSGFYSYTSLYRSDLIEKIEGISLILLSKNHNSNFCKAQYTKFELNSFGIWYDFEPILGTDMLRAFVFGKPTQIQIRVFFDLPNLYQNFNVRLHTLA